MQDIQKLVEQLTLANTAYHLGRPIMTDLEYDLAWRQLRELDPHNPALYPMGKTTAAGPVVRHSKPCLSLNKAMKGEELLPFLIRFKGQMVTLEPKLDGVFLRIYSSQEGATFTLSGDGLTGRNISELFKPFDYAPPKYPMRDYEVIILNENWDPSLGSNQRNTVAGLLNRSRLTRAEFDLLTFIPHDECPREEFLIHSLDIGLWQARCFNLYRLWSQIYPLDGIVLKVQDQKLRAAAGTSQSYPYWAIAWKPPIQVARTTVTHLTWKTTRSQRVVPTVHFTPVILCETVNSKATGNNALWVRDKMIGPGAIIEVGKAGEIIPQIVATLQGADPQSPETCPVCGTPLLQAGVDLVCPGASCLSALIARVEHFYSNSGIPLKGVGRSFFDDLLMEEDIRQEFLERPWLLYLLNPLHLLWERFSEVVGQDRLVRLIASANDTKESGLYTHANFITALGLPGIGWKSAMAWLMAQSQDSIQRHTKISSTHETILQNLPLILLGLQELDWLRPIKGNFARSYALTGTFSIPRQEIINLLQKENWLYDETVTKKTNFLFCSRDSFGSSQKWRDAQKYGVQILGERDLLEKLGPQLKQKPFNDFIPGGIDG